MSLWEIFSIDNEEVVEKRSGLDSKSIQPLIESLRKEHPEYVYIAVPEINCYTDEQAIASLSIPIE